MTTTGIYLLPMSFALFALGPPAGAFAQRRGPKWVLAVGTALAGLSMVSLAL